MAFGPEGTSRRVYRRDLCIIKALKTFAASEDDVALVELDAHNANDAKLRFSAAALYFNNYCKETSSIRKVVDNEKSVVQRNCNRIVCPL
jgi:hypothetical protein